PEWSLGETAPSGEIVSSILAKHEDMIAKLAGDTELPARTLIICNTVELTTGLSGPSSAMSSTRCPD
ncbi:MAG TPA: hypothetical protein VKX49_25115, partial [Bryobacteraceae bacterium]|nr:hypothetical protein [Bryobacteraceae bacterium]